MELVVPTYNPVGSYWKSVAVCGIETKNIFKTECQRKALKMGLVMGAIIEAAGNGDLGEEIFNVSRYDYNEECLQRPMVARSLSQESYKRFKAACVDSDASQSRVLTFVIGLIQEGTIELVPVQAKSDMKAGSVLVPVS